MIYIQVDSRLWKITDADMSRFRGHLLERTPSHHRICPHTGDTLPYVSGCIWDEDFSKGTLVRKAGLITP